MYRFDANGQLTMLELEAAEGAGAPPKRRPGKPDSELVSIPYFHLDLVSGSVDLFGQRHWELRSPWRKGKRPLNTGAAPVVRSESRSPAYWRQTWRISIICRKSPALASCAEPLSAERSCPKSWNVP